MLKRIACGVVVVSFLMLWPVASAVAEEEEAKQMVMLEQYYVFPDKAAEYEALMKEVTEVYAAYGFPYRLDSYQLDDLRYLAIWHFKGMAGIDQMHAEWMKLTGEWGKEESAAWTKKFYATMSHWEAGVWVRRMDLSYFPEKQADEFKYIVWGQLSIKPGHEKEVEELVKESVAVYAKHEVPHAWRTAQGWIGVENPVLGFVEWSASPGAYWMRNDKIHENEELMKDAGAVWAKLAPHVRGYERVGGFYRKELSYRPEKKEAEGD
jgi:hypothetical protein